MAAGATLAVTETHPTGLKTLATNCRQSRCIISTTSHPFRKWRLGFATRRNEPHRLNRLG
eukprot:scaffold396753_cov31-Attheya_sp.AAC.1